MQISGLTPLQSELADRLWACESPEQVMAFFDSLPRNLLHDALVVYHMMIWSFMDDVELGDMTEAREIIEYIKGQI